MSYEVKSGKKRPWQEANSMEADTETNTQKTMSNIHNILPKPIRKLRLEAIFHPKFDNENLSDQKIRNQMIERIEKKLGYLEVTLKHSGSLVLWSGDQRYYSKNSTGNQFTFAAEILLRQHFERAWRQDKEITSSSENRSNEHRYEECSRFLQENRLTLAFEVVTAVLGDHGDTPHKDFVMLTAVADRSQERFYATTEIIQLAHKFRLPHNDSWMFATYQSVNSLFQLYDSTRETAMAQATVQALNKRSCAHVKSMYQHDKFQGEILEGIIIRYIPYTDKQNLDGAKQLMDQLAFRASEILTIIPSDLPQSFQVDNGGKKNEGSKVFCANIRQISQEKGGFRGQESENPFEDALMEVLGAGGPRHEIRKEVDKCVNIPSLTEGLRNSKDRETKRIAKLLEMLSKLNKAVSYSIVQEDSCDDKNSRCLCVIHIHDDRTFQSYHERIDKGSMHLFRGFCIEMSSESTTNEIKDAEMVDIDSNQINVQITESEYTTSEENPDVNETKPKAEKFLMLKMKFLPYIVRTFLCRNKLQVLRKEGAERFNRLVKASLDRLEISYSGRQKWIPFLESWALYVQSCWNHEVGDNLPPLIESNYLVHLKYFSKLYKQGKAPIPFKPKFRGVALVLSVVKENAKEAADCIAERLEANSVELSKDRLILGNVCYAELELSPKFMKVIKQELFAVSDCSAIILYGCNDEDAKLDLPHEILNSEKTMNVRLKQIMGRSQKMKQQDCAALIELSKSTVMKLEDEDADSNEFDEIIKSIQVVAPYDRGGNPPGALVFFSSIPGCGKSTILHSMDAEIKAELAKLTDKRLQNLEVYVREGDKIGKLFWIQAKKDRRKDTSCIFIADKNAPPPSWKLIGSHCSETNGVPIAVLPDPSALKTTHIKGVIYPDGNASSDSAHFYPFSLTYLAICMARVLKRPAKSHPGKLDSGVPNVCMVVISFFCLYRHKSAEDLTNSLEARLQSVGAPKSLEPISVPFFKKSANLDLPTDLSDLLEEALRLQFGFDVAKKKAKPKDARIVDMERRLQTCVKSHYKTLFSKTADEVEAKKCFLEQIVGKVSTIHNERWDDRPKEIKLASIDFHKENIDKILEGRCEQSARGFFERALKSEEFLNDSNKGQQDPEEGRYSGITFVRLPHITMEHHTESSEETMKENFGHLQGCQVDISVKGFLWSESVAALEIDIPDVSVDGKPIPKCKNVFTHITVWFAVGADAFMSNQLPILVESGEASCIAFLEPIRLTGRITFWDFENTPISI